MRQKLREHAGWIFKVGCHSAGRRVEQLVGFRPTTAGCEDGVGADLACAGLLLFAVFAWYDTRPQR